MQVYFIDSDDYFHKRLAVGDEKVAEYPDNATRAIFYARGVLETVKKLRWVPDIIHCQGWIASIVPALIKKAYNEEPSFRDCKVIYSISKPELTLPLPQRFPNAITYRDCTAETLEGIGDQAIDLQKYAIKYADGVTIASKEGVDELVSFANEMGKPVLEYPGDKIDEYLPFFDKIWSEGKE